MRKFLPVLAVLGLTLGATAQVVTPGNTNVFYCPTQSPGTNNTFCASTAFVQAALSVIVPVWGAGVFAALGNALNGAGGVLSTDGTATLINKTYDTAGTGNVFKINGTQVSALAAASDVQTGTDAAKPVTSAALSGSAAWQTLTDNATINWNVASGYNAKVTLLASGHTVAAPTNVIAGVTYSLQVCQDGTGSRTLASWNAAFDWGIAGTPTLTTAASKCDLATCIAVSNTPSFFCTMSKGF